jgi:hypothetical protein
MTSPLCDWTADHRHHPPLSAAPDTARSERQAPARRHETPIVAAGTNTLLDGIINRLIDGDPTTVYHLSPPAGPHSSG